jgi:hypothetical protein
MKEEKVCRIGQIAMMLGFLINITDHSFRVSDSVMNEMEKCIKEKCELWRVQYKEVRREGHSGGREWIQNLGNETGRTPRQVGYDDWILDESGYCGLGGEPKLPQ